MCLKTMDFDHEFLSHRPLEKGEREGDNFTNPGRVWFSFAAYARSVIEHLRECRVPIATGLSAEESSAIERLFGFVFPPDVRSILEEGLPVGKGFPNWRSSATRGQDGQVRTTLNLPMAALTYQIAMGRFWWEGWGPRPCDTQQALHIAAAGLSKAPALFPIYSHCYISSSPCLAGNPVLLLHHGDLYYCGYDVSDFFHRHCFVPRNASMSPEARGAHVSGPIIESIRSEFKERDGISLVRNRIDGRQNFKPEEYFWLGKNTCDVIPAYKYSICSSVLAALTMKVPPWTAKSARRIEFWSDFIQRKRTMKVAVHLFDNSGADRVPWQDSATNNRNNDDDDSMMKTRYVANCLKDVECRLRNGGWKDEDICDIINPQNSCSPCDQSIRLGRDNQNVKGMLSLNFETLSASLTKAG